MIIACDWMKSAREQNNFQKDSGEFSRREEMTSLRSRRYSRAQGGKLEIPPAQKPEEVGQAGRKASWVPVPNCARDFIDSMAVVE